MKDPNSVEFDTLLWRHLNSHLFVFQWSMEVQIAPLGVLSHLLASMAHNSDWILVVLENDPSNLFGKISLLSIPLQQELKKSPHIIWG